LKQGVLKCHLYDPDLNPGYAQLANQYATCVVPARPDHPRDKAIVEGLVKILMRYARFRYRRTLSAPPVTHSGGPQLGKSAGPQRGNPALSARSVELQDGSRLHMNAHTALFVAFKQQCLHIDLLQPTVCRDGAFVRTPECNGCVERAIRTFKEQLLWMKRFDTAEGLRVPLLALAELYNEQ
jgi:hypothetical protein